MKKLIVLLSIIGSSAFANPNALNCVTEEIDGGFNLSICTANIYEISSKDYLKLNASNCTVEETATHIYSECLTKADESQ